MSSDTEAKIQAIDKEILKVTIIDAPGTIMLALGLYAKFTEEGKELHSLLSNEAVVHSLIGIGAVIVVWGGYKIFTLGRQKKELQSESNI